MRIKVNFHIQKMPIIYRHRFFALIKEALNISNPDQKDKLYPPKNSYISKKPKPFAFSIGFPSDYKIKEEKFKIDENTEIKDIVFYF